MRTRTLGLRLVLAMTALAAQAPAQTSAQTPAEKRARYSMPWALRPAVAPNLVRLDMGIAPQDAAITFAPVLTGGYKPVTSIPDLGFYARAAVVHHRPENLENGVALSNPLVFALYTPEVATNLRVSLFAGVTAPIGAGGASDTDPTTRRTILAGIYSRQAMDNALFTTSFLTATTGAALAWIASGVTLQAEATVLQLVRVRGAAVEPDEARTNTTFGLHVGYQLLPALTVSLEGHHQRWLSTPRAVELNEAFRDQTTAGGGLRANVPFSKTVLARPGVAYFHPVDAPMTLAGYRIVMVDVPVTF